MREKGPSPQSHKYSHAKAASRSVTTHRRCRPVWMLQGATQLWEAALKCGSSRQLILQTPPCSLCSRALSGWALRSDECLQRGTETHPTGHFLPSAPLPPCQLLGGAETVLPQYVFPLSLVIEPQPGHLAVQSEDHTSQLPLQLDAARCSLGTEFWHMRVKSNATCSSRVKGSILKQ